MIAARWGVSDDEVVMAYPCDDLVANPELEAWRGVTVKAPPPRVWPWLTQVRVAPYSYDWIDNGGRRSPDRLLGLPEAQVGEPFTTAAGRRLGRILAVETERQLTATIMGAFMSYVLVPGNADSTRLLLKIVARTRPWLAPALSIGDLVMARRQLLNLKKLAES